MESLWPRVPDSFGTRLRKILYEVLFQASQGPGEVQYSDEKVSHRIFAWRLFPLPDIALPRVRRPD